MKWERPHPSNAAAAKEAASFAHDSLDAVLSAAIADRLAGIEEALNVLALRDFGKDWKGEGLDALRALADRVEAEAKQPTPRKPVE